MSFPVFNILKVVKAPPEPFADSAVWFDVLDPSSYTLNGSDVFTAITNKGSKGGSWAINGSPKLVSGAFLHDATTKWIRLTANITAPRTYFVVWECTGADTLKHYAWGTASIRDEYRWGNVASNESNYFGTGMANANNNADASVKNVLALRQLATDDHEIWSNIGAGNVSANIAINDAPSKSTISEIAMADSRPGYNYSNGTVRFFEFAVYEGTMSQALILQKMTDAITKHGF